MPAAGLSQSQSASADSVRRQIDHDMRQLREALLALQQSDSEASETGSGSGTVSSGRLTLAARPEKSATVVMRDIGHQPQSLPSAAHFLAPPSPTTSPPPLLELPQLESRSIRKRASETFSAAQAAVAKNFAEVPDLDDNSTIKSLSVPPPQEKYARRGRECRMRPR